MPAELIQFAAFTAHVCWARHDWCQLETEPSGFLQIQYLHSDCRLTVDQYSHIDTLLTSCGGAAVLRPGHVKTGHQSYNGRIENWKNKILIQILNFMFFRYKKINVFLCLFWCEIILLLFEVEFFQLGSKGWSRADIFTLIWQVLIQSY